MILKSSALTWAPGSALLLWGKPHRTVLPKLRSHLKAAPSSLNLKSTLGTWLAWQCWDQDSVHAFSLSAIFLGVRGGEEYPLSFCLTCSLQQRHLSPHHPMAVDSSFQFVPTIPNSCSLLLPRPTYK